MRTRCGRRAFDNATSRNHSLTAIEVLLVGLLYLSVGQLAVLFRVQGDDVAVADQGRFYIALVAGQMCMTLLLLLAGAKRFEHGLKGFGLSLNRPVRTLLLTLGYFVVSISLTLLVLQVTQIICGALGYEDIQRHEFLEAISQNPPLYVTILLTVSAVVLAPLVEEMLFRGLLQSFLTTLLSSSSRSPVTGKWSAIFITAGIFAMFHGNWQHWPALFVLASCLGYIYERRNSLLIPILIHAMFNGFMITMSTIAG